jgi:hypothetical protein
MHNLLGEVPRRGHWPFVRSDKIGFSRDETLSPRPAVLVVAGRLCGPTATVVVPDNARLDIAEC